MSARYDVAVAVNLKVYYTLGELKCLARGGTVTVNKLGANPDVATVGLRTCVQAVANASPELIGDKSCDYSIYALDATETDADLFEGHGLLSWTLATPAGDARLVSGLLKPSLSGQMFEVRVRLSRVANVSHADFLANMTFFERVSRNLPPNFDFGAWQETCKNAISMMQKGASSTDVADAPSASATPPLITGTNGYLPNNVGSNTSASTMVPQRPQPSLPRKNQLSAASNMTTLQKARELAGRQSTQSMSQQLEQARQQQRISSQQQAQLQALAPPASQSPQLPDGTSPPQMKVFAPPPPSAFSPARVLADGTSPMQRSASAQSQQSMHLHEEAKPHAAPRGIKRKASAAENSSVARARPNPSTTMPITSVAAAQAAAMSASVSATKPGLFKTQSDSSALAPKTGLSKGNGSKQARYCQNCRVAQPKGSWKMISVGGNRTVLCSACGIYWKSHGQMRPESVFGPKNASSIYQQPRDSATSSSDSNEGSSPAVAMPRTSPMRGDGDRQRAIQSSPARPSSSRRPCTPDRALAEISVNTPRPLTPNMSLAAAAASELMDAGNVEDLLALLQTPKRQFEASAVRSGISPSPWKSMFTSIPEDSPSRFKLDKFLEELGMSAGPAANGSTLGVSPNLGNFKFDFDDGTIGSALLASPSKFDLHALMSSPPSMGLFTSEGIQADESATPPNGTAASLRDEDSLFTPRSPRRGAMAPGTVKKTRITREGSPTTEMSAGAATASLTLPTNGTPARPEHVTVLPPIKA